MSRIRFFLFIAFLCTACSGHSDLPKGILPSAEMKSVLWDVLRADELAAYYAPKDSFLSTISGHDSLYLAIFQSHHITEEEFKKSMVYYESHPNLLKPIFEAIQKQNQGSANPPAKKLPDSLLK